MDREQAARILRQMYDAGRERRESELSLVLFGVRYADQLDTGVTVRSVVLAAGLAPSQEVRISLGRHLGLYVTPNAGPYPPEPGPTQPLADPESLR